MQQQEMKRGLNRRCEIEGGSHDLGVDFLWQRFGKNTIKDVVARA
jgi:hypothetical protein